MSGWNEAKAKNLAHLENTNDHQNVDYNILNSQDSVNHNQHSIDPMDVAIEDCTPASLGILPLNLLPSSLISDCDNDSQEFWTISPSLSPLVSLNDDLLIHALDDDDEEEIGCDKTIINLADADVTLTDYSNSNDNIPNSVKQEANQTHKMDFVEDSISGLKSVVDSNVMKKELCDSEIKCNSIKNATPLNIQSSKLSTSSGSFQQLKDKEKETLSHLKHTNTSLSSKSLLTSTNKPKQNLSSFELSETVLNSEGSSYNEDENKVPKVSKTLNRLKKESKIISNESSRLAKNYQHSSKFGNNVKEVKPVKVSSSLKAKNLENKTKSTTKPNESNNHYLTHHTISSGLKCKEIKSTKKQTGINRNNSQSIESVSSSSTPLTPSNLMDATNIANNSHSSRYKIGSSNYSLSTKSATSKLSTIKHPTQTNLKAANRSSIRGNHLSSTFTLLPKTCKAAKSEISSIKDSATVKDEKQLEDDAQDLSDTSRTDSSFHTSSRSEKTNVSSISKSSASTCTKSSQSSKLIKNSIKSSNSNLTYRSAAKSSTLSQNGALARKVPHAFKSDPAAYSRPFTTSAAGKSTVLATLQLEIEKYKKDSEISKKRLEVAKTEYTKSTRIVDMFAIVIRFMNERMKAFSNPSLLRQIKLQNFNHQQLEANYEQQIVSLNQIKQEACKREEELKDEIENLKIESVNSKKRHEKEKNNLLDMFQSDISRLKFDHEKEMYKLMAEKTETERVNKLIKQESDLRLSEIEELRKKLINLEKSLFQGDDKKMKAVNSKMQFMTNEIQSLKDVLELKESEARNLKIALAQKEDIEIELQSCKQVNKNLNQKLEQMEISLGQKSKTVNELKFENESLIERFNKEKQERRRISMRNEELEFAISEYNTPYKPSSSFSTSKIESYSRATPLHKPEVRTRLTYSERKSTESSSEVNPNVTRNVVRKIKTTSSLRKEPCSTFVSSLSPLSSSSSSITVQDSPLSLHSPSSLSSRQAEDTREPKSLPSYLPHSILDSGFEDIQGLTSNK